VSNPEDENPDFDTFDLPAEEGLEPGPLGDMAELAEDGGLGEPGGLAVPAEAEAGEEEEPEEEEKKEKSKGPGFLEKLATTSPYVVLLGIALAAILIGILCLFMELGTYGFQIKPPQAGMAPAVHSGPASTTATA